MGWVLKPALALGAAAGIGVLAPSVNSYAAPALDSYAAAASLTCNGSWQIVPSPNVGSDPYNQLNGVAIVSPGNIWAVGGAANASSVTGTLTEHWNGHRWRVVPSPSIAGASQSYLSAVAAVPRSNQLWATGISVTGGAQSTLIERWNGKRWKVVPSPNVGTVGNSLTAVVALSAKDVWAAGAWSSGPSSSSALIEHWTGRKWRVVSNPPVAGHVNLLGLASVPGTKTLWAGGGSGSSTLTERFSAGAWHVVASPGGSTFYGIAARTAKDVWGVGSTGTPMTLTEHWNGARWNIVTSPDPGSALDALFSVALVPGHRTVWAVGEEGNSATTFQTLVERWSGRNWKVVASANASAHQDFLHGVATTGTQAWAVGSSTSLAGVTATLIEHYC